MNKLHLLRRINDNEQFSRLSTKELHLLLLMIACSANNSKGDILLSRIKRIFNYNLSSEEIVRICEKLRNKEFVSLKYQPVCIEGKKDFCIMYQILHPETLGPETE